MLFKENDHSFCVKYAWHEGRVVARREPREPSFTIIVVI